MLHGSPFLFVSQFPFLISTLLSLGFWGVASPSAVFYSDSGVLVFCLSFPPDFFMTMLTSFESSVDKY